MCVAGYLRPEREEDNFWIRAWKDQVMDEDSSIVKACREAGGTELKITL
jgi:hypothetical protein